jgi:hypothetical protein
MLIEAEDFAGPKIKGKYNFGGAKREQNVAALEKLVAAVRDGRVLVQKVTVSTAVDVDDWLITTLSLSYAEQPQAESEQGEPETGTDLILPANIGQGIQDAINERGSVKELWGPDPFSVERR